MKHPLVVLRKSCVKRIRCYHVHAVFGTANTWKEGDLIIFAV